MPTTPFFAAALGLIYLGLSFYVIRFRLKGQVSIGDGGNEHLALAMRLHGNFIEYVPLALLLLYFFETITFASRLSLILGVVLVLSRLSHIVGLRFGGKYIRFRQLGAIGTFAVIATCSVKLILHYL